MTEAVRPQLRQPRVANLVAERLRDRILGDEQASALPKQDDLLEEFGVSMPSIREALRILETEGLVTVQRGKTGGAVVRRPTPANAAYMLALVLQSQKVGVDDVAGALRAFEPACAALAAERADRATSVVPQLRARIESSRAVLHQPDEYMHQARLFHEELVAACGNRTTILVVGALESLWSSHVDELARRPAKLGSFEALATRKQSVAEHVALVDAIEQGDAGLAERLAREHLSEPSRHDFVAAGTRVRAQLLHET